jgi:hypothetical protein
MIFLFRLVRPRCAPVAEYGEDSMSLAFILKSHQAMFHYCVNLHMTQLIRRLAWHGTTPHTEIEIDQAHGCDIGIR